jgi:hypothetical protein
VLGQPILRLGRRHDARKRDRVGIRRRGVVRGGILFLRADDAVGLTDAARQKGIRVLGVDAFRLSDDATEPLMQHSVDFSSESRESDLWTKASDFIRSQPTDRFFEVVLAG